MREVTRKGHLVTLELPAAEAEDLAHRLMSMTDEGWSRLGRALFEASAPEEAIRQHDEKEWGS